MVKMQTEKEGIRLLNSLKIKGIESVVDKNWQNIQQYDQKFEAVE